MRERPQSRHIHAGHGDAGQSTEAERREQPVTQRHAEAGQRAKGARGEIKLSSGAAIGQADQRDDGKHVAGRDNSGEPAGLRVGQGPGVDELRQQRRNNGETGEAKDLGGAYGGNDRYRRRSRGGSSQSHAPTRKPRLGEPGFWGLTIEQGEMRSIASS